MNAPEMLAQLRTPADDGLVLRLKTLTPLYTGGIGQLGDQLHPSNLLGGIRQMSCLVARTLGDAAFEAEVWGNAGGGGRKAAGKQLALHWDTSRLERKALPSEIKVARGDGGKDSRWWFNTGFEGDLSLQITRRGISDTHWQILTLALAIQLRHGSFGAKDQFGLGVLAPTDDSTLCLPLDAAADWPKAVPAEPGRLNLLRYAFGRLRFRAASGQRPALNRSAALTLALATRATLRNALRAKADATEAEKNRLTDLRHRMLGKLNQAGSAVNVSAGYASGDGAEVRLAVALKPEDKDERAEVMKAFSAAATHIDGLIGAIGYRVDDRIAWEFGGKHANERAIWLNKLAGV
jgi:hypothetical protein